jgi:hypothetical protein
LTGFQPTSLHAKVYIETQLHQGQKGTLSFWFSPLEDLDFFPRAGSRTSEDRHAFYYPFISDVFPPNQADAMHSGRWYQLTLTWDKAARKIEIYANGVLMDYNHEADGFMESRDRLYIGCPMMVMRELEFTNRVLPAEQIKASYQKQRPAGNDAVDAEIARLTTPAYGPASDLKLDESWRTSYTCSFTKEGDLDGWHFQTDESSLDSMIAEITPEGLYFKTPDKIDNATRLTLWGAEDVRGRPMAGG